MRMRRDGGGDKNFKFKVARGMICDEIGKTLD
jgi:hypothetical protein